MRTTRIYKWLVIAVAALSPIAVAAQTQAGTVPIMSDSAFSTSDVGSFTGSLEYDPMIAILEIVLTNTTPVGFITGVAFNIDSSDAMASATQQTAPPNFVNLTNLDSAAPFGPFDAGSSLVATNFNGSGNPNGGVAGGATGTWTFLISASDSAMLTETDFISAMNSTNDADFLVRIRGIPGNPDSDKVPGKVGRVVPLPGPLGLSVAGLVLVAGGRRRKMVA